MEKKAKTASVRPQRPVHGLFSTPRRKTPVTVSMDEAKLARQAERTLPSRNWVVRNLTTGRIVKRAPSLIVKPHLQRRFGQWALFKDMEDARRWPWPLVEAATVREACDTYALGPAVWSMRVIRQDEADIQQLEDQKGWTV